MHHTRVTSFLTTCAFVWIVVIGLVMAGVWGSEHIPLWVSGPALAGLVVFITWQETRP